MEKDKSQYRNRSRRPNRTPDGAHSGATKFDKWLKARMIAKENIIVVLKFPLYEQNEDTTELPEGHFLCKVIEVDRYSIALEFQDFVGPTDGGTWWIQKDQIRAVSVGF